MAYDYSKLLGRIIEAYGKQSAFAKAMNMSEHTLSCKLNNNKGWKQQDIEKACELLKIPQSEIGRYFFTIIVHN